MLRKNLHLLQGYEVEAIVAALQRDVAREEERVHTDPAWSQWHKHNVHMSKRALETIMPYQLQRQYEQELEKRINEQGRKAAPESAANSQKGN